MVKVFTRTADMAELIVNRREQSIEGDLTEVDWLAEYAKGLEKCYTPEELKFAITESNNLVDEQSALAGFINYVEHEKITLSRKADESEAHKANAEKLGIVDLHRALVPCNNMQLLEGMSASQLTATCRIYGLKVDTDKTDVRHVLSQP